MRGKVYFLFYLSIVLQEAKAFTLEIGEGGLFNNNKEKKFQVLQKFFFFFFILIPFVRPVFRNMQTTY